MNFKDFIKNMRLEKNLSLRRFCELTGQDPSNWSKVERGLLPLSLDREKLDEMAGVLELKVGERNWTEFFNLATIAKREIPEYVYENSDILEALPIFFRTASKEKPTDEELNKLINLIKNT